MDPTAAPTELKLNGTTYTAYPFRDLDHESMNKWVRREYLRRIKSTIEDDPILQERALETVATMYWSYGTGVRIAMSASGVHKIASLMCRNQSIPVEDCLGIDALEEVMDVFKELHPIEVSEVKEGGDNAPK